MPKPATKKQSPVPYAEAIAHLSAKDKHMAEVIARVGPCGLTAHQGGFSAMVHAIVNQQLSGKAAQTILNRLCALFPKGEPSAAGLLALSVEQIRACGVSGPKANYLRDLAQHVADGRLDFDLLPHLIDEAVTRHLTAAKGIGRWSAEMYLIFHLERPDVFPVDDSGLRASMREVYGLKKNAKPAEYERLAEKWRPWRSVAVWYLYAYLDVLKQDTRVKA